MIPLSKLRAMRNGNAETGAAMDGADCACACDAAPKKQQTLEQHLKQYHHGQMPKGDCSWLKQYKKDHPNWKKDAAKATKGESAVDTADKGKKGTVKKTAAASAAKKPYVSKDLSDFNDETYWHNGSDDVPHQQAVSRAIGDCLDGKVPAPHVHTNKDGKVVFIATFPYKGTDENGNAKYDVTDAQKEEYREKLAKMFKERGGAKTVVMNSGDTGNYNSIEGYVEMGAEPEDALASLAYGLDKAHEAFSKNPVGKETELKAWYKAAFPTDDLGDELSDATFGEILDALNDHKDVYEVIGEGDSVVRERVFTALGKALGVDYDTIYDKWLEESDGGNTEPIKPTWKSAPAAKKSAEKPYDLDKNGGPLISAPRRKEIRDLQKKSRELLAQANEIEAEGSKNATHWMDAEQYGRYQEILKQSWEIDKQIADKKYNYYKEAVEAWKADKEKDGE